MAGFYKGGNWIFVAGGIEVTRVLRQGEGVLVSGAAGRGGTLGCRIRELGGG
jgi:hypothetical protein